LDPNLNVGLPIFTIHGNHDDPSGADNLSAVDILSSCKLVNYFGKQHLGGASGQRLSISPVLIKKVSFKKT
jgi:double-strand break repair protein MRE11